ncbi:MAG: DUF433 domain-containing protein [Acidimicrobiia bacterium]
MLLPRGDQLWIHSFPLTTHRMEFERIIIDPAKMRGVPCIRGLRIQVATGRSNCKYLSRSPSRPRAHVSADSAARFIP